jgi:hypothetical protein
MKIKTGLAQNFSDAALLSGPVEGSFPKLKASRDGVIFFAKDL